MLQANIAGYQGRPSTVIGGYDSQNKRLVILREDKMKSARFGDASLITNQPLDDYDTWFSEEIFKQSISDFRDLDNSKRLVFDSKAAGIRPTVQVESFTETGAKVAVSGDITNAQIGVVALCYMAKLTAEFDDVSDMFDSMYDVVSI